MNDAFSIIRCDTYNDFDVASALERALGQIDGLRDVRKGMRVVIKPNLVLPRRPEACATTHPQILKALTEMLISKGAEVIIGDSPGGPFSEFWLSAVYEGTHITGLTKYGAKLNYDTGVERISFPGGRTLKGADVAEFILNADAVISAAKLKTHTFMQFSGAVKNLFGAIPGTVKAEYHQLYHETDKFADMLVDLAELIKPQISIIDAVTGMEGNGPNGGKPRQAGAIIASKNPHTADLAGSWLIGIDPFEVPTLKRAIERGLCPASVEDVLPRIGELDGLRVTDFKKPDTAFGQRALGINMNSAIMKRIFRCDPEANESVCAGCGECKSACPPKAIEIKNGFPRFDRKKCIRCFCCQELCPQNAIYIKRTRIAEFLQKAAQKHG
ncbi:MAG: Ferredoxin-2 [Firmicutes bacterium ADurb.Bin182]|nr:MAG: Ferredoxin-2 [Firmicutes bacterium ADurb.Bin182]